MKPNKISFILLFVDTNLMGNAIKIFKNKSNFTFYTNRSKIE